MQLRQLIQSQFSPSSYHFRVCSLFTIAIHCSAGPKYPFSPRHLYNLQRKTDTLNGRELTHRLPVQASSAPEIAASTGKRVSRKQRRDQLNEYQWRVADDDDNLQEDLLSPKYSSF